jgi:transcriptional regulator with XRE-family HTH domain
MGIKSPDKIDVEVGQRIRLQRQTASLSQTRLADGLGVTFQQVQKYEKGVTRVGAGRLTKIAHVLGVPISSLLGTDDDHTATRKGPNGTDSPLELLAVSGALRLLRGYDKIEDRGMRRSLVDTVEGVAFGRKPLKRERRG